MNPIEIHCENTGSTLLVEGGESLRDVARRIELDFEPVCARVNNKT